ncbi:hypothetical protein GCM10008959_31560 [Deinococcus seoulensis]|uniref:Uncharacterized protein n=1 Tax=Deinococcus seoulensis TaxID=1837379 RepID=A0ABQ2RXP2_9DEIO|nr:hypothetical protein [Deinococcus seoulensis]GGR67074.1 hypothetical protein GCM10008959_31560 [Deinococcus seoulensis]
MTQPSLEGQFEQITRYLPDSLFLDSTRSESINAIALTGGPDDFTAFATRIAAPVVFVERYTLTEDHFDLFEDPNWSRDPTHTVSLLDATQLRPFHHHLGDDFLITLSVPHAGMLITLDLQAFWWDSFTAAHEGATEQHRTHEATQEHAVRQQRQEQRDRELLLLRTLLPEDTKFRQLACEAHPRITALRQQAQAILQTQIQDARISAAHDETVRETAAAIKAEVRAARRRS